jgi:hypothetical protein
MLIRLEQFVFDQVTAAASVDALSIRVDCQAPLAKILATVDAELARRAAAVPH